MPTSVKENYLKALYFLNKEDSRISVTELSNRLNVSKPSANNMIKSLQEHSWVMYEKYKPLQLTEEGRKAAAKVIRKHRLTEMFLVDIMGFGWEEVHEIAEQVEHINSEKLFARMDEMLGRPSFDPHGSPIPDEKGEILEQKYFSLSDLQMGQKAQLCAIANSSKELLHYLNKLDIQLGTIFQVLKTESFDNSLSISYDEKSPIMISEKVSRSLLVKKLPS
ncbi:MAG: metal-dependent transcriptional regulator [Bacteroidota bacterium]